MAKAYEMEMVFSASVGLRQINEIMEQMGCNDQLQIRDALAVSVKQVLPTIPGDDYIKAIADAIKENYKTKDFTVTECRFTGYKYIREITRKEQKDG